MDNYTNVFIVQRAIISKARVMALTFCLSPNVLYSSVKFHDSGFVFLVLGFGFKALSRLFHL